MNIKQYQAKTNPIKKRAIIEDKGETIAFFVPTELLYEGITAQVIMEICGFEPKPFIYLSLNTQWLYFEA